jgi:N-acetyl-gamma-glutamylphosphate reductase
LYGAGLKFVKPEDYTCDVVFELFPRADNETGKNITGERGKVIDLGADFRLKDRDEWERIYGKSHSDWQLAEEGGVWDTRAL